MDRVIVRLVNDELLVKTKDYVDVGWDNDLKAKIKKIVLKILTHNKLSDKTPLAVKLDKSVSPPLFKGVRLFVSNY